MTTRSVKLILFVVVAGALARPVSAQHAGHQAPGAAAADACAQGARQAVRTLDRTGALLEAARQANAPARLRAEVDNLQAAIAEVKEYLAPCMAASGATMDHAAMGHQRPAPAPLKEAIDPVCGMKVDPKTAPQATFEGKTYYFCSASDRDQFVKDPKKFLGKKP